MDTLEDIDLELILLDDFDEEVSCFVCGGSATHRCLHPPCGNAILFCAPCIETERSRVSKLLEKDNRIVYCVACAGHITQIEDLEFLPL